MTTLQTANNQFPDGQKSINSCYTVLRIAPALDQYNNQKPTAGFTPFLAHLVAQHDKGNSDGSKNGVHCTPIAG